MELGYFISAHSLMILFVCAKFQVKYLKRFQSYCAHVIRILQFTNGDNFIKNRKWNCVRYLFCAFCLIMLYICMKFSESTSDGFRMTNPNRRVDASVVANVDGRTNGRRSGSLYRAMPEAGATIIGYLGIVVQ